MINHHFLAPRTLKPLKSNPRDQNLPGLLFRDHSDHWGPVSAQFCGLSWLFFDPEFLHKAILGPLKKCFDQLDQKNMNKN